MKKLGVYVHIPFCVRKCNYCDFYSHAGRDDQHKEYVSNLIREITNFDAQVYVVDTVFFGGGTPSILSVRQLDAILSAIFSTFRISDNPEISIEVNPATIKDFHALRQSGFNRVSIGAQSANNHELALLGRLHTWEGFVDTYVNARQFFDNINVDLMFGLPDQTLDTWRDSLQKIKALVPEHISCYSLTIEPGTPFANTKLNLPSEDTERDMNDLTANLLAEYIHYEISNYALPGRECRHNLKYWTRDEYVGFGASAHSFLGGKRIENHGQATDISQRDALAEHMFLGLRLTSGVELNTDIFDEIIEKHVKFGTMQRDGSHVWLTPRGMEISNVVLADFL